MRVLFQTYDLAFLRMGGGERVMMELQRSLAQRGVLADVYDPWRCDPRSYDLHHYFSTRQLNEPVVGHGMRPLVVTPTLAAAPPGRGLASRLATRLNRRRLRQQLAHAAAVLPATDTEKNLLAREIGLPSSLLRVLPNGIDPALAHGDAALFWRHLQRKRTGPLILSVGRFEPTKNQMLLIRAAATLPGSTLVFLGDADPAAPSYLMQCKELAATLKSDTAFLPAVPASSPLLAAAYAAADVYVQPSRFETYGLAAVEACAAGCSLALSTGMAEKRLFGEYANYFDPSSAEACAEALSIALSRGRAPGPRSDFAEANSWSGVASKLHQIYIEALK